ncbi:hypothetical protein OH733_16130 [Streptomyces griseus]|uniref:hypothetical protein n=1 Tax=Streptomyces griseus TaxID=1911 RepID=UPI00386D0DA8|nr:hypothetical protein OH733_16130 [Streptomyces griseus]WTD69198.1 hypothetical protein OH763_20860 [Streptomyces griseus]
MAKHQVEVQAWMLTETQRPVPSEDEYDSMVRSQWLESARAYDPHSSLAEELILRLRGDAAQSGGLDLTVGGLLLKPLQEAVTSAAEREVKLLLVGISPGSTVLHFRPAESEASGNPTDGVAGPVSVDTAVHRIIDLVTTAESGNSSPQWGNTEKSLGDVARVLAKFDLTADLRWMDQNGGVTSSSLSERGRNNVASWHEEVPSTGPEPVRISGRVTVLDEFAGSAKIKTGLSKRSKAYSVLFEPGDLVGLQLTLGQEVSFTVEERPRIKKDGSLSSDYFFVSWDNRPESP